MSLERALVGCGVVAVIVLATMVAGAIIILREIGNLPSLACDEGAQQALEWAKGEYDSESRAILAQIPVYGDASVRSIETYVSCDSGFSRLSTTVTFDQGIPSCAAIEPVLAYYRERAGGWSIRDLPRLPLLDDSGTHCASIILSRNGESVLISRSEPEPANGVLQFYVSHDRVPRTPIAAD